MPRPSRLTPKKGFALYGSLQVAWGVALAMEPTNWKELRRTDKELRALEAKGFDRPPKEQNDLEVE